MTRTSKGKRVLRPLPEISLHEASAGSKQALSWHQVGTKLALSREEVKDLLSCCSEPKGVADILERFKRTDRTKFKNKYINPLLREGFLGMTQPKKPNSPLTFARKIVELRGHVADVDLQSVRAAGAAMSV